MENNSIQTNPQVQTMRKVSFFMNIAMGITVSIILSTHGVLASGHFAVPMLIISMVISCILALCIGFFLPVKPVKDKMTENMKMPAKFLVANVIIDGHVMEDNLLHAGKNKNWLFMQMNSQNIRDVREVLLATCDMQNKITFYPKTHKEMTKDVLD